MISVDTLEDNTAFAAQEGGNFPILADPTKEVATAYGVLREDMPFANRWTYYIGPDGRILYIDSDVQPRTAGEDTIARLEAIGTPVQ